MDERRFMSLNDPAHEGALLQPQRHGRVRGSTLGGSTTPSPVVHVIQNVACLTTNSGIG